MRGMDDDPSDRRRVIAVGVFLSGRAQGRYTRGVRGDSLRDLYAKSLALVGLGVLAGAGALVDYWPVAANHPAASSALVPPAAALPLPSELAAVPSAPTLAALPARHLVASRKTSVAPSAPPLLLSIRPVPATGMGLGDPIDLHEPQLIPVSIVADAAPEEDADDRMLVSEAMDLQLRALPPVALSAAPENGSGSLITGAFRKTGSSIVKTGARTGASIVDAMRIVGGVVRRALPN